MGNDPLKDDPELERLILAKARDQREVADSAVILRALRERGGIVGGAAGLPPGDAGLDEKILTEARRRSAEISAATATPGSSTRRINAQGSPVPWWVWLAWAAAIAGVIAAWRLL